MRPMFVFPLLLQGCGAWVWTASSWRSYYRSTESGEPRPKLARLPLGHGAAARASWGSRLLAAVEGGDPPTEGSSTDNEDGGISTIKARLTKPVGLVLAEKEIGLPGLVVDDMTETGSAKGSGIVQAGMTLVSAGGVDCGELVFDQVVELLQNSTEDEPIDFVFSAAEATGPS